MSDDEWISDNESMGNIMALLEESTVERLQREIQEVHAATTSAYKRVEQLNNELQQANKEFQRQKQLLNVKHDELKAAQLKAAQQVSVQSPVQNYFAELKRSRQGKSYIEWMRDASLNQVRQRLYNKYKELIGQITMPAFGKYQNEKN